MKMKNTHIVFNTKKQNYINAYSFLNSGYARNRSIKARVLKGTIS